MSHSGFPPYSAAEADGTDSRATRESRIATAMSETVTPEHSVDATMGLPPAEGSSFPFPFEATLVVPVSLGVAEAVVLC